MSSDSQSDKGDIRDRDGMEIRDQSSLEEVRSVGPFPERGSVQGPDPLKSQGEQELIVSILERNDGTAHIRTIAKEMGVEPHDLTVPLESLSQTGSVKVIGSGIRLVASLTRETSEE